MRGNKDSLSEIFQSVFFRLLVPILVGIGSAFMATVISVARIEDRMDRIEADNIAIRITQEAMRERDNDYEKRVSKLEAYTERNQRSLDEIRQDVKTLLRRSAQ